MNGYLVLTRKKFEQFSLTADNGQRIEIKIVDIQRGKVRLAIQAERSVKILRRELEIEQPAA